MVFTPHLEEILPTIPEVRPSPIAGQWYPAEPARLAGQIDSYLEQAELPEIEGETLAVIVPHAGHRYSGQVAATAFAALRGLAPEVVAVVSPMHYPYVQPVLTTAHARYATPLGELEIDREVLAAVHQGLEERTGIGLAQVANDPEHAVEIELPFLQRVLEQPFRLAPFMLREQRAYLSQALGLSLAVALREKRMLLVASSDLSHFYPQPAAERLDAEFLHQVLAFDPEGVLRIEEEGKGFACGRGAVAAVLWAAQELGAVRVQQLSYATSGTVTGEYDRVVGYAALVVTKSN